MRRTCVSTILRAVSKAPIFHRSFPSATAAAVTAPLFAGTQQRLASCAELADATRYEMEDEQRRSGKQEKPKVPTGWTLDRKAGERLFTMRKTFEDEEILLRYRNEITPDDGSPTKYEYTVFITSKGKTLMFDMTYEDGEVLLDHIAFLPDSALALDESAEAVAKRSVLYGGPDVNELDDNLSNAFLNYLDARGVNDELGEFVEAYGLWAEQAEYEAWLSAVHQFVA
ncbi:Mitochondrial glycoprotein [Trypanosoma melophagium]|uniref:Mitochondrial glycoprotein n=1 Tax=Trypanosoma melophagium TaxID=715481 RepID=UPI00351A5842|nr:Mitochondrial glycoprotein [Trypanosoma melophagium]